MAIPAVLGGCGSPPSTVHAPEAEEPGGPLPGLTDGERERFLRGRDLFNRVFTPEEGLGPLFNENQCSACHTDPVSGGTGEQIMLRASIFVEPDSCDLLPQENGENLQTRAIPPLVALGISRRRVPPHATHTGRTNVPFLFGGGLVEGIPAGTLEGLARAGDGRPGRDTSGAIARFGRKAEHATLEGFIAGALLQEMGLTTPRHPAELPLDGGPLPPEFDLAPDPEISAAELALLVDFVRFLAPLPRQIPGDPGEQDAIARGEEIFDQIGCTACHTPFLDTGPSEVAALDRKRIHLYSDLLLHDMGPGRAGACGVAARPSEIRTEPLMGLGRRRLFLHDSRVFSLPEAIDLHGGEAAPARERWRSLDETERARLVRFLQSL